MQTVTIGGITYNAHPMRDGVFFMFMVGRSGRETKRHRPGRLSDGIWTLGGWAS